MNRLTKLPRGFGAFPLLEVLDLSYNNLNENELPANFWIMHSLRALYLRYDRARLKSLFRKLSTSFHSDNDFEYLSPEIGQLTNLCILAVRDNELVELPQDIGRLHNLRELHLQGNRLTVLPPQLGDLDFLSSRAVLKLDNNPWVPPIEDQLVLGVSHVVEYIRTETYKYLFSRHMQANLAPPEKSDRSSTKKAGASPANGQ